MAYQTINEIFSKNDSDLIPSEAHGLASGMLCINNKIDMACWLRELFAEELVLLDEDKIVLESLFERTRQLLNDEDSSYRFDLFLPRDDEPIQNQLEAIRFWCDGFLFGLGYNDKAEGWPKETDEIMKDIIEFSKLDTEVDQDEDLEESEVALMEIQEYLRMAVIIVRDQFYALNKYDESN